jgi:hypothetical protein
MNEILGSFSPPALFSLASPLSYLCHVLYTLYSVYRSAFSFMGLYYLASIIFSFSMRYNTCALIPPILHRGGKQRYNEWTIGNERIMR